ncbi:MAG: ABC transporter permease [Spirochaetaceae bacterium]|jgi:NitT/TauT family transport system permease protein|nr:ABC transporter permease [Spirochaetaceae bacterium]
MKKINYLICFIIFNGLWFFLAKLLRLRVLPNPVDVYLSWERALKNGVLGHITASVFRTLIALFAALFIALILGIAMGYSRRVDKILSPITYLSYPVPKLALMPVIMLLFGIGELSKIIITALIIVFQLIISIRDAVKQIPEEDYDLFTSLNASHWNRFRHITIPAALPAIFSSLRVSVGTAISVLMIAESYGTDRGLGFYIIDTWMRADYLQMYFGIFCLAAVGFLLFAALDAAQAGFCKG